MKQKKQSEADFQRQIIKLANATGWRHYHQQYSLGSDPGWPDLVLVKPPRIIIAELKRDGKYPTDKQSEWLKLLSACPGVEVFVWRPADTEEIIKALHPASKLKEPSPGALWRDSWGMKPIEGIKPLTRKKGATK